MSKTSSYPVSGRGPADHDVRDQIVIAATEHFSRYGYEKTAVSDLAKAIGFSKAYIYKFFESKQAIGEMICSNCLREIETEVRAAVDEAEQPPEKLRRLFKVMIEASLRLFFQDRKLYEIATSAVSTQGRETRQIRDEAESKVFAISEDSARGNAGFQHIQPLLAQAGKVAISSARRHWTRPRRRFTWCCALT